MTKKTIDKAFKEMVESINTVKEISRNKSTEFYKDYSSYTERVDFLINSFCELLGSAYLFELINESTYKYGYSLLQNYSAPSYFDAVEA